MKNHKYRIFKAVLALEKLNIHPTTKEINKYLKSNYKQENIYQFTSEGFLSFSYETPGTYIFISNLKTLEYISQTRKNFFSFWATILTLIITFATLILTLVLAL